MNILWQQLLNQLDGQSELTEELQAVEFLAGNINSPPISFHRQKQLINKLQKKIGNSAFQKLIESHTEAAASPHIKRGSADPGREKADSTNSKQHNFSRSDDKNNVDDLSLQSEPANLSTRSMTSEDIDLPPDIDKNTETKNNPGSGENTIEASDYSTNNSGKNVARKNELISLFSHHLPRPSLLLWQQLSELFEIMNGQEQAVVVEQIVNAVNQLKPHSQEMFFRFSKILPVDLVNTLFTRLLLIKLSSISGNNQINIIAEPGED